MNNNDVIINNKSKTLIFYIDILDGYSFRQLFDFCKSSLSTTPFFISKDKFNIKRGNSTNKLILDINFYSSLLLKYYVNESHFNNKEENIHIITPNLIDFFQQIKNVPKQGSLRIFQYVETPKLLHLQIYGGNKTNNGYISIKIEDYIYKEYNIDDKIYDSIPNCKISLASFCSACDTSIKYKSNFSNFKCYDNLIIYNINSDSAIDYGKIEWTNDIYDNTVDFDNDINVFNIKITNCLLKNFSKLININSKGIIKIYCKCENILKLVLNIGLMGKLTIYIINEK